MITLTREEAQQVLDALSTEGIGEGSYRTAELLRARLGAHEPEPVACPKELANIEELYTAPPQREWQGLTDEEIDKALWENESNYLPDIIRIAEAKLKEKNGG